MSDILSSDSGIVDDIKAEWRENWKTAMTYLRFDV